MNTMQTDNLACRIRLLEDQIDVVKKKAEYASRDSRYEWELLIEKMVDRLNDLLELANTTAPGLVGSSDDEGEDNKHHGLNPSRV
ncbi:hypothetical protein [Rubinisphaera sp.]|uniref:hypothetical protein n=1 Tax=Rubinisphaera sp. TaxID=2024857 RepID=UPI000C0EE217|nr:hypothetical protein [Rubinisphaera sp.]MBV10673.1 hypothetical protein [Rubinisphaera sp.]HCS52435.1 hypothetical protein [Planctomycetaceae bacterium]|tara:strand:+ start:205 stop:459 length:255 start_codon:yes stop_codon:yes gene_type:complete